MVSNRCPFNFIFGNRKKHLRTTQDLIPEGLLNHCEGLRSTFPKIGTKFDAHSLFPSLIHRENRHGSRTRLRINACENCRCPPSYVQLGTLTRHISPTIFRCFALLQLLYRWRHQSRIFWIPHCIPNEHGYMFRLPEVTIFKSFRMA
jgi:hypothetical protein